MNCVDIRQTLRMAPSTTIVLCTSLCQNISLNTETELQSADHPQNTVIDGPAAPLDSIPSSHLRSQGHQTVAIWSCPCLTGSCAVVLNSVTVKFLDLSMSVRYSCN
jgi:hypothetical protein